MAVDDGVAKTREFISGLKANLARKPVGNDRDQARAIYEKKCDLALLNSYYMGIMSDSPEQKKWADSVRLYFPNQAQGGSYVLTAGAALTSAEASREGAQQFLEYLTSEEVQSHFAKATYEYPLNPKAHMPELLQKFGAEQPEIKKGVFARRFVALAKVADMKDALIKILDEVGFDK
jgi:iron(III) transport system substrate-binding protein